MLVVVVVGGVERAFRRPGRFAVWHGTGLDSCALFDGQTFVLILGQRCWRAIKYCCCGTARTVSPFIQLDWLLWHEPDQRES